jgi:hypothetical protein
MFWYRKKHLTFEEKGPVIEGHYLISDSINF